jgi:hypothetical protein
LLLAIAVSLASSSALAQSCDGFTDVPASSPFCPDVTWLKSYGITEGCSAGLFCPDEDVTRLQMAAFMHRLGKNPAFVNGGNAFGSIASLGTTDNNSLALVVNGAQAMLVQPVVDGVNGFNPNIINGSNANSVMGIEIAGATIAGGGGCYPGTGGDCSIATSNTVTGSFGTVGGGIGNTASTTGTVPGGQFNTANGYASFAAGFNANANDDYSFVWGDGTQAANSTGTGTFSVLATGGIGLYPGSGEVAIVSGAWSCTVSNGSTSWACSSDRNLKENFEALDLLDVLQRVVEMPVTAWTFIGHPDLRHIGPVAQDFHATFGLGNPNDDTHIDMGDSQGVALAAIKGLNAKVDEQNSRLRLRLESALQEKSRQLEEQAATIREQQREIAELKAQMQTTQNLAGDVVALQAALSALQRDRETVAVK